MESIIVTARLKPTHLIRKGRIRIKQVQNASL
jgi:hypothetical protein